MSTISNVSSGGIQWPDFSSMEQALFNKTDADGDGSINQDELNGLMTKNPRLAKAFSSLAANPDGSTPSSADVFKKLDTDGDGKVSATEFTAGLQQAHATMRSHGHHHAPPPPADSDDSDATDGTSSTEAQKELKSLLEDFLAKLQQGGGANGSSDSSSTSKGATDSSSASAVKPADSASTADQELQNLLTEILQKMKQQTGYASDGSQSAGSATSAALFQVTA